MMQLINFDYFWDFELKLGRVKVRLLLIQKLRGCWQLIAWARRNLDCELILLLCFIKSGLLIRIDWNCLWKNWIWRLFGGLKISWWFVFRGFGLEM